MNRRLRLGMVGGGQGGYIGWVHRLAARLDDCYEFVAGALSSDEKRAQESGRALFLDPSRIYTDYREMAAAEAQRPDGIDAVAIVTPNHLHAPVAKAFLEAGIHVICDKPLALSLAEAIEMRNLAQRQDKLLAVTYTYSGYPMTRHAKDLVAAGELGDVRFIAVEYVQDWLTEPVELHGNRQAEWRTDPTRTGAGGCLGDIGTHAYHLASFVAGMLPDKLSADVASMVPGRRVDDHVQATLFYESGARGNLIASQIAAGEGNALRLRVYGTKGRAHSPAADHAARFPAGHPEGFFEAFAQLYRDAALQIAARLENNPIPASSALLTDVNDGVEGMRFVEAALRSHAGGGSKVTIR